MIFPDSYFEDEVRDGFYVSSMMKRAWAAQLEVLDTVQSVCETHGIQYFAEWGTLLGAVRHGGFIPWDDDIDICMKREDYRKFVEVADQGLPDGCWLLDYRDSDEADNMLGRVLNARGILPGEEVLKKYHGFPYRDGIDIFQLDFLPPDPEKEKAFRSLLNAIIDVIKVIVHFKSEPDEETWNNLAYAIRQIERVCQVFFDEEKPLKQQLYALIENKLAPLYGEDEAEEITILTKYYQNENYRMPKVYYQEGIRIPFETTEIVVPVRYDSLLQKYKYGNFMKLVRVGSTHENYPTYKGQQECISEYYGIDVFEYQATKEELEQAVREKDEPLQRKESLKTRVKDFLPLFREAHETLAGFMREGDPASALEILGECQNTAVQIGNMIEEKKGEGHATVTLLEQYCETLYRYYEEIAGEGKNTGMQGKTREEIQRERMAELTAFEKRLSDSIEQDLEEKREIVFIPYKPSLWGTMDSVWQSAVEEDGTEVYVIPVPYYYKDVFGTAKKDEPHYETEGYPDYVAITSYEEYHFEAHHPDTIVIQCPYDEYNYALTVHPFFYARNLKQYTDQLVYIPAFVMDEIGPKDGRAREMLKAYCNMPGVVLADRVIVQSEQMKGVYVELLTEFAGGDTKEIWENKISGSGFPVYEYEKRCKREDMEIPAEWLKTLKKSDSSWKKIVLYGTSASALLCNGEKMIEKMREVFASYRRDAEESALIWRPDPKAREMLRKNHSALWNQYRVLLEEYRDGAWGILDTSNDWERAVNLCDEFLGDAGVAMNACNIRKKPTTWQSVS